MLSGKWQQFKLLTWKNYLLRKRRIGGTVAELIAPIFFFLILVIIRQAISSSYKGETPADTQLSYMTSSKVYNFAYYADNVNEAAVDEIVQFWMEQNNANVFVKTNSTSSNYVKQSSMNDMVTYCNNADNMCLGAVAFTSLGNGMSYTIRVVADEVEDTKDTYYKSIDYTKLGVNTDDNYYNDPARRFWTIQSMIDRALMTYTAKNSGQTVSNADLPEVFMSRYPYPSYEDDDFASGIGNSLGLFIVLAWIYSVIVTTRSVVMEKEMRLKEAMKLMGLRNWINWLSWWFSVFVFFLISVILVTIITVAGDVVKYTSGGIIFIFFMFFALATISFCFLMSSFFDNSRIASAGASVIYFLLYIPFFFYQQDWDNYSRESKMRMCIFAPTCAGFGAKVIATQESLAIGVTSSNISDNVAGNDFTFSDVLAMLLFDWIVYMLIAWYVEAVFPGTYGIPERFYYFLTPNYWIGNRSKGKQQEIDPKAIELNADHCEEEPSDLKVGVQIRNLRKVFGDKVAVDNLSLNMYEDQITSFLGHNGAGKTTTMNMLTGMFPCSGGDAFINGYSIKTNIKEVRSSLGLCPQFDILFDHMTVSEHLEFYCLLKNVPKSEIEGQITEMLDDLQLSDKRKSPVVALSGGMKRKLSVAISLIGDSKVVILDEPTAGMDPYARRATWDLLLKHKKGRTMLLTTHFMDEADLLGDRIGIVHSGRLCTMGSSLFLKSKYGIGYHMVVVKEEGCASEACTELLRKHIPEAQLVSDVGAEISYILPSNESSAFGPMFRELEANKNSLRYASYGISVTTLEEVFLKVGEIEDKLENKDGLAIEIGKEKKKVSNEEFISDPENGTVPLKLKTGHALRHQQFNAMVLKRWHHSKRDWKAVIAQLLVPAVFALLAMLIVIAAPSDFSTYDPLNMNLAMFTKYNYQMDSQVYSEYTNSTNAESFVQSYFSSTADLSYGSLVNVGTGNLTESLLNLQNFENPTDSYISVQTNGTKNLNAYYNDKKARHASPVSLNFADNVALKSLMGSDSYSITTQNWPLPSTGSDTEKNIYQNGTYGSVAILLIFGLSIAAAYYVLFLIHERTSKAKHMQFISGVDAMSYWSGTFVWDSVCYIIPTILIGIIFLAFNQSAYVGENFLPSILLILFFGWSAIPLMYCFTFKFDIPSTGFVVLVSLNILFGLGTVITTQVLDVLSDPGDTTESVNNGLKWAFQIFPFFAMGRGLSDIGTQEALRSSGASAKSPWDIEVTGRNFIFMGVEGFLFFFILYIIEKSSFGFGNISSDTEMKNESHDDDVEEEAKRIQSGGGDGDLIKVDGLGKIYKNRADPSKDFVAVRNLTFGVPAGECFGLLGVNGAGKTTTFKMLTGDHPVSNGNAYIDGFSTVTEMDKARQRIGYCPQFDALIETLTAEELLTMYAKMRGVRKSEIKKVVDDVIDHMGLRPWANRVCGSYSGGNKRKLSTAVTIVGDPPAVFLDEPTTGMDPQARRFLWNAISEVFREGRSVVLTSHSMEECEALCTRLAVMVNGEFKCIGSPQHLKSKFGKGYNVMVKVGSGSIHHTEAFKEFMMENFPSSILKEEHFGMCQYEIPRTDMSLGAMFETLESVKPKFDIADYSVSQTTLEQVFIGFAQEQRFDV
eukprot:Nk52_evm14s1360 gene=Nk52_evmTU14s1360